MCGIFALLNNKRTSESNWFSNQEIESAVIKGQSRGPEYSAIVPIPYSNTILAFHRLKINGVSSDKANQPFSHNGIYLICNGEIYNWKSLAIQFGIQHLLTTGSDCEILIHLYEKIGMDALLKVIEGEFAFILVDTNLVGNALYVVRDPIGIRPLYFAHNQQNVLCFSSELKMISPFPTEFLVEQFRPGHVSTFYYSHNHQIWSHVKTHEYYCIPRIHQPINSQATIDTVYNALSNAIKTRIENTERPIACLLSGGLDSSLVSAIANRIIKEKNPDSKLDTYSIGLAGSEDLYYAKQVADFIGSNHTEIVLTETNFLEAIPEVIYAIESYDTTTVRASIGNYLVSKFISRTSENRVVLCGDGADELMGGYLYFHNSPDAMSFELECRRLLKDIHLFDVLRADKSISSNGLEGRVPFLDINVVDEYLRLPVEQRMPRAITPENAKIEKAPMREIAKKHQLLPETIIKRHKEAFSDGVASKRKSLFESLQEKIGEKYGEILEKMDFSDYSNIPNIPKTLEEKYYRMVFEKVFGGPDRVGSQTQVFNENFLDLVPYRWMPNFMDNATDPSARTLSIYQDKKQEEAEYTTEQSFIQQNCVEIQNKVREQMKKECGQDDISVFVGYHYPTGEYLVV